MPVESRVFANVNVYRPKECIEYDKMDIIWNTPRKYQVIRKVGRGKYSEVYEGFNIEKKEKCTIKVLKPVRFGKIKRYTLLSIYSEKYRFY